MFLFIVGFFHRVLGTQQKRVLNCSTPARASHLFNNLKICVCCSILCVCYQEASLVEEVYKGRL
jgi:hypothetical protein